MNEKRTEGQIADQIRVRTDEIPEWTQIRLASAVVRMVKNREKAERERRAG